MAGTETPTYLLPALDWQGTDEAHARVPADGAVLLPALITEALRVYADEMAGEATGKLVSVSLDMSGEAFSEGDIGIRLKTDRKTRSLLFVQASLSSGDRLLIRATSIFRLV